MLLCTYYYVIVPLVDKEAYYTNIIFIINTAIDKLKFFKIYYLSIKEIKTEQAQYTNCNGLHSVKTNDMYCTKY